MNHPAQEEWMAYLYGELPGEARASMEDHLQQCDDCRDQVDAWRAVMEKLDTWELPAEPAPARGRARLFAGAVAALLLLALGFGAGLWSAPRGPGPAALRATVEQVVSDAISRQVEQELKPELARSSSRLRAELRAQLAGDVRAIARESVAASEVATYRLVGGFFNSLQESRRRELSIIASLLERLKTRYVAEYSELRGDLEKLAVLTRDELALTERQMYRLIGAGGPGPRAPERSSDGFHSSEGRQER